MILIKRKVMSVSVMKKKSKYRGQGKCCLLNWGTSETKKEKNYAYGKVDA